MREEVTTQTIVDMQNKIDNLESRVLDLELEINRTDIIINKLLNLLEINSNDLCEALDEYDYWWFVMGYVDKEEITHIQLIGIEDALIRIAIALEEQNEKRQKWVIQRLRK